MGEVSRGNSSLAKGETKARTVEGKAPGGDKSGTASVKAEHCYPRGQGMKPDWHTGKGLPVNDCFLDLLYRTAVYVIRMYGGVGGGVP